MAEQPPSPTPPTPPPDDSDLEPMGRDVRFIYRLVLALIIGVIVAAAVGWKLKTAAAGCGSGLVRPGQNVIPPENPH